MADGMKKNLMVVGAQIRQWWWAMGEGVDRIGEAIGDRDILEAGHVMVGMLNDTVKVPNRLWTYLIVIWLAVEFLRWLGLPIL